MHAVCECAGILFTTPAHALYLLYQGQANRWIKNMETAASLEVVKTTDKDLLRTLENGIRFGRPVSLMLLAACCWQCTCNLYMWHLPFTRMHFCWLGPQSARPCMHNPTTTKASVLGVTASTLVVQHRGVVCGCWCVQVLLEDLGEGSLDAALEPLLLRATFKQGGSEVMKLGDNVVPYHQDFK